MKKIPNSAIFKLQKFERRVLLHRNHQLVSSFCDIPSQRSIIMHQTGASHSHMERCVFLQTFYCHITHNFIFVITMVENRIPQFLEEFVSW